MIHVDRYSTDRNASGCIHDIHFREETTSWDAVQLLYSMGVGGSLAESRDSACTGVMVLRESGDGPVLSRLFSMDCGVRTALMQS